MINGKKALMVSALSVAMLGFVHEVADGVHLAARAFPAVLTRVAKTLDGGTESTGVGTSSFIRTSTTRWNVNSSRCLDAKTQMRAGCSPDSPRIHPNPMDDEFSTGATLNTSKWTWLNQNGATSAMVDDYLIFNVAPVNRYVVQGITQRLPSPPYQFIAKFSEPVLPADGRVNAIGLGFYETSTKKLAILWFESPHEGVNMPSVDAQRWVADSFAGPITGLAQVPSSYVYLGVASDGKDLSFGVSTDGRGWTELGSDAVADPFTKAPDKVGIFFLNHGKTVTVAYGCAYFRRTG